MSVYFRNGCMFSIEDTQNNKTHAYLVQDVILDEIQQHVGGRAKLPCVCKVLDTRNKSKMVYGTSQRPNLPGKLSRELLGDALGPS